MANISAVVITHNEEHNIKDCLQSINWAGEIIVVDSHSKDNTVEISKRFTDKVFLREFDNFSAQKNFGLSKASFDWILSIDADERVTDGLKKEIEQTIKNPSTEKKAFYIKRLNNMYGKFVNYGQPDYQLRLFRKTVGRFEQPVHEEVRFVGEAGYLKRELIHYSMKNLSEHLKKMNQYTDFEIKILAEKGVKINYCYVPWYFLMKPFLRFVKSYLFMKGFRDGIYGFVLCVNAMFLEFFKSAKYWERHIVRDVKDDH
ncbi:MAG: glycosyltransferase family 2 protein [Thermodesulfobacteriota bacterium]